MNERLAERIDLLAVEEIKTYPVPVSSPLWDDSPASTARRRAVLDQAAAEYQKARRTMQATDYNCAACGQAVAS